VSAPDLQLRTLALFFTLSARRLSLAVADDRTSGEVVLRGGLGQPCL